MKQQLKLSKFVSWHDFNNKRYLFCSKSGAFVEVDDKTETVLKSAKTIEDIQDKSVADYCISKGILVSKKLNEIGMYRFMSLAEQYNYSPQRMSYTIAITEKCNYRCRYCFETDKMRNYEMTTDIAEEVVKFIKGHIISTKSKELRITWFGGEPLLNMNALSYISEKLIKFCDEHNVVYSAAIITNGSLITDDVLKSLIKYKVSFMQVTLDGDEKTSCLYKGSTKQNYNLSIAGIVKAAKCIRTNVRFNTDGMNIESIISTVDTLYSMISDSASLDNLRVYLACIEKPGECMMPQWYVEAHNLFLEYLAQKNMKDNLLIALPQSRYASCGAPTNSNYYICADGNIVKCEHYLGMQNRAIGSVFEGLFHNSEESRFRDIDIKEKCKECSMFPICRQGCLCKRIDENCEMNCENFFSDISNILRALSKVEL